MNLSPNYYKTHLIVLQLHMVNPFYLIKNSIINNIIYLPLGILFNIQSSLTIIKILDSQNSPISNEVKLKISPNLVHNSFFMPSNPS